MNESFEILCCKTDFIIDVDNSFLRAVKGALSA